MQLNKNLQDIEQVAETVREETLAKTKQQLKIARSNESKHATAFIRAEIYRNLKAIDREKEIARASGSARDYAILSISDSVNEYLVQTKKEFLIEFRKRRGDKAKCARLREETMTKMNKYLTRIHELKNGKKGKQ